MGKKNNSLQNKNKRPTPKSCKVHNGMNGCPKSTTLVDIMNRYVETGESNAGKMPLSNSNKYIHYIFSNHTVVYGGVR